MQVYGWDKHGLAGLLLAILLFVLYPIHFALDIGGGGLGGVNLSYGDAVVVIIGLIWCTGLFKSRNLPRYTAFVGIFVAIATISFVYNFLTPPEYFDTVAFFTALAKFLGAVAWMIVVYIIADEFGIETIQYALFVSVCLAAGLAIGGVYQSLFTGVLRPSATFNNPNLFGNYLLFHIFISTYLIYSNNINMTNLMKMLLYCTVGIISIGLFTTGSRGSIIGLTTLVAISILLLAYRGQTSLKTIGVITGGSILAPIAVLAYNPNLVDRLTGSRNVEIRLAMWEVAADLFFENPIMGIGFGQLSEALREYAGVGIDPHNIYVLITVETGAVGSIVFFGLILLVLRDSIMQSKHSVCMVFLASGLLGLLMQGTVTDIDNFRSLWITIGLIAAHKELVKERTRRLNTNHIKLRKTIDVS